MTQEDINRARLLRRACDADARTCEYEPARIAAERITVEEAESCKGLIDRLEDLGM